MRRMTVRDLGVIHYDEAFAIQKRSVDALQRGLGGEVLYLLEHPHVITLGRNASIRSLLADRRRLAQHGVTLVETDRGGDATYHGPGQLVGYPILELEEGRRDIRRFVRDLEDVLIRTLSDFGLDARRDPVHRGVWIDDRKIASVGIRISRWVTCHGFALNVATDLGYFSLIHPCGIVGCRMTSIERELGRSIDGRRVKSVFIDHFAGVFSREITERPASSCAAGS